MNDIEKRINKMIKKSEVILNAGKQTNEEYLKSRTTEQLAELLTRISDNEWKYPVMSSRMQEWLEWLKQPHITGGTK